MAWCQPGQWVVEAEEEAKEEEEGQGEEGTGKPHQQQEQREGEGEEEVRNKPPHHLSNQVLPLLDERRGRQLAAHRGAAAEEEGPRLPVWGAQAAAAVGEGLMRVRRMK